MRYVGKNPPGGGGRNPYQLIDYKFYVKYTNVFLAEISFVLIWKIQVKQNEDFIHLLPSLEGDTKICPTQKIHVARGHGFSGWDKLRVSRLTGQLIVYYTESCSTTLYSAERCGVRHDRETRRLEGNTTICSPSTWLL